jgi:hypothetical protein
MKPQPNQIMTICFKAILTPLEGEMVSWEDDELVLKTLTGTSHIVIPDATDKILFYRITSAKIEYEEIKEKPIKTQEDVKNIAEMKKEINQIEKEEIRERLNIHIPTNIRETHYGFANYKVKSTPQHTREETPRKDTSISSELQDLFRKKH